MPLDLNPTQITPCLEDNGVGKFFALTNKGIIPNII